jgi:hypothetical protein
LSKKPKIKNGNENNNTSIENGNPNKLTLFENNSTGNNQNSFK